MATLQKESGLKKADIADIADNKVIDFILELIQNLYCGDSPYGPETREYKITCAFLNVIDSFLNTIHFSIGKVLNGAESVRSLVEPLLWNPGPCDAEATLKIYPVYDDENPAPAEEIPVFNDPVKKSKKGSACSVYTDTFSDSFNCSNCRCYRSCCMGNCCCSQGIDCRCNIRIFNLKLLTKNLQWYKLLSIN